MTARVEEVPHWQAWCRDCRWYGSMNVEQHDAVSEQCAHNYRCPYAYGRSPRRCPECAGYGWTTTAYDHMPSDRTTCEHCGGTGSVLN